MSVKVLLPITITDSMVTASVVTEPVAPAPLWVSGATYAVDALCSLVATQRRYRRLVAGAGTTAPNLDATNWVDAGAEPVGIKWVSGTTYAVGELRVYAKRTYRRLVAGAGTTAPNLDATNWVDDGPAPTEIAWLATESYEIGEERIRSTTHRVYTSLASGVDAGLPEDTPLRWKDTRPTNKLAEFDNYRATTTKYNGTLTKTVKPGIITDMAFYGLVGDTLRVVCKNAVSGTVYWDETTSLSLYLSGDLMWEFYFGVPLQQDSLRVSGLYPQDAQVEITLTPSSVTGTAEIGLWALGTFNDLGIPQVGVKATPVDYSYVDIDKNGEAFIEPGLNAKNISGTSVVTKAQAQAAADVIYRLLGKPVAVIVTESIGYGYLNAFGLLTAEISPIDDNYASISFNVRGLI